jgi:hypothetical protein
VVLTPPVGGEQVAEFLELLGTPVIVTLIGALGVAKSCPAPAVGTRLVGHRTARVADVNVASPGDRGEAASAVRP